MKMKWMALSLSLILSASCVSFAESSLLGGEDNAAAPTPAPVMQYRESPKQTPPQEAIAVPIPRPARCLTKEQRNCTRLPEAPQQTPGKQTPKAEVPAVKKETPMARKYPQCKEGKFTSGYAEVRDMARDVLGLNVMQNSLVEIKNDSKRAQYWVENNNGVAQLHLIGKVDMAQKADICQIGKNAVQISGCANVFFTRQCFTTVLSKTSPGNYRLAFQGHPDWDSNYKAASTAPIAR
jgi:hypothetical protein